MTLTPTSRSRSLTVARSAAGRAGTPVQRYSDGAELPAEDLFLRRGAVAAHSQHPNGRSAATEIIVAPALLLHSDDVSHVALGDVWVTAAPEKDRHDAQLLWRYWRERSRFRNAWLNVVLFERTRTRVAFLLLVLADAYTAKTVPVRLTYSRIAHLCGITERSVERCVGRWLRGGLMERHSCHYTILDPHALAHELGEGALDRDAKELRRAGNSLAAASGAVAPHTSVSSTRRGKEPRRAAAGSLR